MPQPIKQPYLLNPEALPFIPKAKIQLSALTPEYVPSSQKKHANIVTPTQQVE